MRSTARKDIGDAQMMSFLELPANLSGEDDFSSSAWPRTVDVA